MNEVLKNLKNNKGFFGNSDNLFLTFCTVEKKFVNFDNLTKFTMMYGKISKIIVEESIEVSVYYQQS